VTRLIGVFARLTALLYANLTAAFLGLGLLGVVTLITGLAWDSYLHARDPTLAHREGLFTLANPGHVLLGAGIFLVAVGLLGAAYTYLPFGYWTRRGFLAASAVLMVGSGATVAWAASAEWSAHHPATGAAHSHSASALAVPVTAEELAAAARLVAETRAALEKYRDQGVALRAGYTPMEPPDVEIVHFVNRAYFTDADVLKPEHVQSLIYYNSSSGPVLIGAMYIMPRLGLPGPQIGGPLTNWHHHDDLCFDNRTNIVVAFVGDSFFDRAGMSRSCPPGSSKKKTPEMLHVWVIDNPNGPFDSDMQPEFIRSIIPGPASG
jgi:hypothetical protein